MADTNVRIIVDAIDKATGVLQKIGKNIDKELNQNAKKSVDGLAKASVGVTQVLGTIVKGAGMLTLVAAAAGAAMVGLGFAFKPFIEAAAEAQRIMTQTNAVIASTGGVAGMSASEIVSLAKEIQNTTPVSDEAAQAAENMLLTFTSIGHEIFPDTTKAVVDMATAMNGGLVPGEEQLINTSVMVGKALNDPILGMTTLRRVGIQFTDQQKEMAKQFIDTGQGIKAQQMILDKLTEKFGGSGAAALLTYLGQTTNLQNRVHEFKETVGNALIPTLGQLAEDLTGPVTAATQWVSANLVEIKAVVIGLAGVFQILGQVVVGVARIFITAMMGMEKAILGDFTALENVVYEVVGGVAQTYQKTQDRITDMAVKSYSNQEDAANKAYNGIALAHSAASAKIAKDIQKENEDFERAMEKRKRAFEESMADLIFAHIDKRDSLIKDLGKENKEYEQKLADRVRDFKEKMADMIAAHEEKVKAINKQISEEDKDFNEQMVDKKDSYDSNLVDMKKSYEQKVKDISKQIDKETAKGRSADQVRIADLQEELEQEKSDYADKVADVTASYDKEVAKAQESHQEKLTDYQTELAEEDASNTAAKAKAQADEDRQTAALKQDHLERVADYQAQVDAENTILNAHQAEVAAVKDQVRLDDIARKILQNAEEEKIALDEHNRKLADIKDRGKTEGEAYNEGMVGPLGDLETMMGSAGQKGGQALFEGISTSARQAGESLVTNFINGAKDMAFKATQSGLSMGLLGPAGQIYEWYVKKKALGQLPFQTGGIVPGAIGQPVPIMAHAGERVTPSGLSETRGGRLGGGVTFNVSVGLYAGTETEKRNIAKQLYGALLQLAQSQNKTVAEFMNG